MFWAFLFCYTLGMIAPLETYAHWLVKYMVKTFMIICFIHSLEMTLWIVKGVTRWYIHLRICNDRVQSYNLKVQEVIEFRKRWKCSSFRTNLDTIYWTQEHAGKTNCFVFGKMLLKITRIILPKLMKVLWPSKNIFTSQQQQSTGRLQLIKVLYYKTITKVITNTTTQLWILKFCVFKTIYTDS